MATSLAQLNRQVLFGQSQGRIIWQPHIGCWFTDKLFMGYEFNACFRRIEDPAVQWRQRALNSTDTKTVIETPVDKIVDEDHAPCGPKNVNGFSPS